MTQQRVFKLIYRNWSIKFCSWISISISDEFYHNINLLTLIVMLLVRIIALIFLLILSPIAWLLWIFPNTQKYWQQWWQEFIRWNFSRR